MSLRPFFTYFGGKWRAAPKYPPPIYDTIIEPFAGSAGYSLRYPERKIILVEKSPVIAGIWRYLIGASEREILALPLLEPGGSIDSLASLTQEQRWLVGMWLNAGVAAPRKTLSAWEGAGDNPKNSQFWGEAVRSRLAHQLKFIRHWDVSCDDYSSVPDLIASWFIDPPYEGMGKHYPCGADEIDFARLAEWSRSRRGQVLVCEQTGAKWLPFAGFGAFSACVTNKRGRSRSAEALWMNDWPGAALWLPAKES